MGTCHLTPHSAYLPRQLPEVAGCIQPQSRASIGAVLRLALSICLRSELGLQPLGALGGPRARRPCLCLPHGVLRAGGALHSAGTPFPARRSSPTCRVMRCRAAGPQGSRVSPLPPERWIFSPDKTPFLCPRPLRRRYLRGLGRRPGGTRRAAAGLDSPGLGASSAAREGSAGLPRPAPRRSPPSSAFLSRSPAYPGAGGYCPAPLAAAAPATSRSSRRRTEAPRPPPAPASSPLSAPGLL